MRFFISHAGPDKPLAIELKALLEGDAWVDLFEIDLGDVLWHEISDGIEAATDFVLLWSAASARSKWVQYETTLAFTRWLEDSAIALRIICLDDTPVPLRLRPFLQARDAKTPDLIAQALRRNDPAPAPRRRFFNRNDEIGAIEEHLYDSSTAALWICGVPGSGKRSLAREALQRITTGQGTVAKIRVTDGVAEPELDLLVASALQKSPSDESSTLAELTAHTRMMVQEFVGAGGVLVFEDAEHWLAEDGTLGRLAEQVITAASEPDRNTDRLVIFTSRRRPRVAESQSEAVQVIYLHGLQPKHALPLLRSQGAEGSDEQLMSVTLELDGHPLALEVVAPQLPLNAAALNDRRHDIATDLIDPGRIAGSTWRMLEVLSLVDGPLNGEDLANSLALSAEGFSSAVDEATSYALVRLGDSGALTLHPLLRDYYLRSFRKQPDYESQTTVLADLLLARLQGIDPDDETYTMSLLSTVKVLGLSGRLNEARELRQGLIGTLYQTGVELFHERRYEAALEHLEAALTGDTDVDLPANRVRMKTLAYLKRMPEARALGDDLVREHARDAGVLRDRGRVEQIDRKWSEAIMWYERAIPFRSNKAQLYADIAQARVRMEDWPAAAAAAKTAIDMGGDTPYALSTYSQALEAQNMLVDARKVMAQAVAREPKNPRYRYRLGRIALQLDDRPSAMREFARTIELDPQFVEAPLSLASVQIDEGLITEAKETLARINGSHAAPSAVLHNVKAKLALVEGDLASAQSASDSALKDRRDAHNLTLAIRVAIARAEAKELSVGQASAQVKLLAKELEMQGHLAAVLEISQRFPKYFD
ncbi:toll/interleukin-1 receptor domain-containing protein [Agromyces sp. NDB4Y10]|uniref:toll/interleukin-1 receptor domain-containing protein n=1 Tax=Agromyces sp. NDB4Y10 TaxID=1775951 RepID=UPI0018D46AC0|nr:toll/interleukin-1 receptor domain-containing protein [Agromyces sp. NDB4Y10]